MASAGAVGGAAVGAMGSAVTGVANAGRTAKSSFQEAKLSGASGAGLVTRSAKNIASSAGRTAATMISDKITGATSDRPSFGQRTASHSANRLFKAKNPTEPDA
jgi:hypothetical protein